jgi:hypothetical protein
MGDLSGEYPAGGRYRLYAFSHAVIATASIFHVSFPNVYQSGYAEALFTNYTLAKKTHRLSIMMAIGGNNYYLYLF